MTQKFIYFSDIERPDRRSIVWLVMLHSEDISSDIPKIINSYAAVSGAWFEPYSESALMRLILVEESVFGRPDVVDIRFETRCIDARDFVWILQNSILDLVEKNALGAVARLFLHRVLHADIFKKIARSARALFLPSPESKNLNQSEHYEGYSVAIAAVIVVILYLLAAVLETMEKSMLLIS